MAVAVPVLVVVKHIAITTFLVQACMKKDYSPAG
jgi:hypothetical protein